MWLNHLAVIARSLTTVNCHIAAGPDAECMSLIIYFILENS